MMALSTQVPAALETDWTRLRAPQAPKGNRFVLTAPDANPEVLMRSYQAGDPVAATALIHLIGPPLHRYFLADAVSRAHADDLLQETWLRIHRVRHTYRPGEPVLPWFYAIARHVRIDHFRKVSRTTAREEELTDASETSLAASPDHTVMEELDALLAPLPANQREVIEMLKVAGMSLEEVARATSSTVGSVKQRVHRAYKRLRQHMLVLKGDQRQDGAPP
jgi:RNA polymerase sigma-70 factor (ECF subfamily)